MNPEEKALKLYNDAMQRWCIYVPMEKRSFVAKSIADYICKEMVMDRCKNSSSLDEIMFWVNVKKEINKIQTT
jgi:hypothetical protein